MAIRNLIVILGDQLNADSAAFDNFDPAQDAVTLAEVHEEAAYIPQHKIRLVLFFSAMRHFRDELAARGIPVHYRQIDDPANAGSLPTELEARVRQLDPQRLILAQCGDHRVLHGIKQKAAELHVTLEIRPDRHFYSAIDEFQGYTAKGKKLILENFYRQMRQKHGVLMEGPNEPAGGQWNFDKDNRLPLTAEARRLIRPPRAFPPDALTHEVIATVEHLFPDNPGRASLNFDYPVTRTDALAALDDFVQNRLVPFGPYEDAIAVGEPYLFHSRLSSSLNLHLLNPREVVDAAAAANAPLNSTEGFVRQVLGWREYVRGIYWQYMPDYQDRNALHAQLPVPRLLWTAQTDMNCLRHSVEGLIDRAYAHHIQRLMVMGLFALLLGVHPRRFNEWHLGLFADAIDWVSLPNTLGMSQYADGGVMATKPYCASGNYIHRMSDACEGCRYRPEKSTGPDACPFTTLYWDFLARHREPFSKNGRMLYQINNLNRQDPALTARIRSQADALRSALS